MTENTVTEGPVTEGAVMAWLHALRRWARSDRIRASPRDRELLRLRPGACVRVGDTFAQVIARNVRDFKSRGPGSGGGELYYTCRSATAEFHLRVRATAAGAVRVQFVGGGDEPREVKPGDIEAFG